MSRKLWSRVVPVVVPCVMVFSAVAASAFEWQRSSPESQGFSSPKLEALRADLARGGRRLCWSSACTGSSVSGMPRGTRRTRRTARPPDWLMMHREKGKADEENNRLPCIDDPSLLAGPGGPPCLHATTYEVAQQHPQASDDAPGTAERPWKTIAKAAEKAGPGDVVVLRGGVYRERVVLRTSGTAQAPIQFEAAPGEEVVVTGADLLSGWQQADETRPIFRVPWPHKFIG